MLTRVQFDFSEEALSELEYMRSHMCHNDNTRCERSEVIQVALALLKNYIEVRSGGGEVQNKHGREISRVTLADIVIS